MPLKYRFTKRRNPLNTNEIQHIMQAVSTGTVDLDQIAYEIANECTLNEVDVKFVLMALAPKMMFHLEDGKIVDLDYLGKFKIGMKGKAQPSPELLRVKGIQKFHLNFQPSVQIKRWLKKGIEIRKEPPKK
jgi:predicted histone-like DNA-binding protein